MPWITPTHWEGGDEVTPEQLNENVRDNLNILRTTISDRSHSVVGEMPNARIADQYTTSGPNDDARDALSYALQSDEVRREIVREMAARIDRGILRGIDRGTREELDVTTFSDSTRQVAPSGRVTPPDVSLRVEDRPTPTMAQMAAAAFGFGEAFRNAAEAAAAAGAALDGTGAALGRMRLPEAPRLRQPIRVPRSVNFGPERAPRKPKREPTTVPPIETPKRRHIDLGDDDE